MSGINDLVKKNRSKNSRYWKKKYFATSDFNTFWSKIIDTKIKKELVNKSDIAGFVNDSDLNKKI